MKKEIRLEVLSKYDSHCAYCGKEIQYKQMQVDHIIPQRNYLAHIKNNWKVPPFLKHLTINDVNHIDNLHPACVRCNKWKDCYDLEGFRNEIKEQLSRLKRDSSNYRMAIDFKMIEEKEAPIKFYFETEPWLKLNTSGT